MWLDAGEDSGLAVETCPFRTFIVYIGIYNGAEGMVFGRGD